MLIHKYKCLFIVKCMLNARRFSHRGLLSFTFAITELLNVHASRFYINEQSRVKDLALGPSSGQLGSAVIKTFRSVVQCPIRLAISDPLCTLTHYPPSHYLYCLSIKPAEQEEAHTLPGKYFWTCKRPHIEIPSWLGGSIPEPPCCSLTTISKTPKEYNIWEVQPLKKTQDVSLHCTWVIMQTQCQISRHFSGTKCLNNLVNLYN